MRGRGKLETFLFFIIHLKYFSRYFNTQNMYKCNKITQTNRNDDVFAISFHLHLCTAHLAKHISIAFLLTLSSDSRRYRPSSSKLICPFRARCSQHRRKYLQYSPGVCAKCTRVELNTLTYKSVIHEALR